MSAPVHRPLVRALAAFLLTPALVLSTVLVGSPAQAQKIKPEFWGMHDNDWRVPPSVPVTSANLTPAATYWSSIEPTKGDYNWTKLTQQIQGAEAVDAQPMMVLGRTPKYASEKPKSPDFADYMPSLKAWKAWVTKVAKRYGGRLDYQIWPEPNIVENWKGSPRQMAKLTVVAAKILNRYANNPKIVSPALAVRLKGQREWMKDFFKQSIGGKRVHQYVDAIAIDPFPVETGKPEDSFKLMKSTKRTLARMGVRKPIWNNEINYGVKGGFQDTDTTLPVDVQQSYVIRTFALSAAAKMQRTYWLSWFFEQDTMAVKMSEADGTALPPATSYTVVRSWLNKTKLKGCDQKSSGLWVCTARKGTREFRRIYWAPRGDVVITTPRSTKRVENQEGSVNNSTGSRKIRVDYRPIMVASKK